MRTTGRDLLVPTNWYVNSKGTRHSTSCVPGRQLWPCSWPCGADKQLLSVGHVQGETRQGKTRQDKARHKKDKTLRGMTPAAHVDAFHYHHDAVRLTLQPDRRACEPEPEPGRRRQTRARHSIVPRAGASGTTTAKAELEAATATASCASCSVQCSPVSSCTAATARHLRGRQRQRRWTLNEGHAAGSARLLCPRRIHLHAASETSTAGGMRCFWCCVAMPVATPSLAHNRPAAPAAQSSRPRLQSSRWALTAASPSSHASATTRFWILQRRLLDFWT